MSGRCDPDHSTSSKKGLVYDEVQLISSVTSVASIAIKNARLYEKACIEARTDEMTGLLNRKYFYEVLNEEFEKNKEASLALAIINVDDFKLYNQLYGVKEGTSACSRLPRSFAAAWETMDIQPVTAEKNLQSCFRNMICFQLEIW